MIITDKYVFFSDGILSNKSNSMLFYKSKIFFSAEQLFIYLTADLFNDSETKEKILAAKVLSDVEKCKSQIKDFNQALFDINKEHIMETVIICKSIYCEPFRKALSENIGRIFILCDKNDNIWSCGLDCKEAFKTDDTKWPGENLYGKLLTKISKVYNFS